MKNVEKLSKKELLNLLIAYNNYIINFFDEHEEGMIPCCVYEFLNNEYVKTGGANDEI